MSDGETGMTNEQTESGRLTHAAREKARRRRLMMRAREVFGKYSGPTDISRNHDACFADSILGK